MSALGGLIAGSVVMVALGAFKVIEKLTTKKNGSSLHFSAADREKLNNIAAILRHTDSEGVPMAYMPRRLIRLSEQQNELTRMMAEILKSQGALSERLYNHLTEHEQREEKQLQKISIVLDRIVTAIE